MSLPTSLGVSLGRSLGVPDVQCDAVMFLESLSRPPVPAPARPRSKPWDGPEANRLMCDADALVGELNVSGTHPDVAAAADRVVRANMAGDMRALRAAVSGFEAVVRKTADGAEQEYARDEREAIAASGGG